MAFFGHQPVTGGPNDPTPVQLSQQQLAFAFHQFQYFQQMQSQTPLALPPPPPPPPTIDPALQARDPNAQRLDAVERDIQTLKADKRVNADPQNGHGSSKRRKTGATYILKDGKQLEPKQAEVRGQLMVRTLLYGPSRSHSIAVGSERLKPN